MLDLKFTNVFIVIKPYHLIYSNSRFCNSYGTKYAKIRAKNISRSTLNVNHRHIVFTIDQRLRTYFLKDSNLLNFLFAATKDTLYRKGIQLPNK
ncbi:hypothetical protein DW220_11120 [Eubacterium sp. AM18-26]|nr:hypothetical protein DW220_11120 [Eubacterium sp. AM18-26]RHO22706.1 hypothetical protein DW212_11490 [Eubacterium sp. AM18-10LB-B]